MRKTYEAVLKKYLHDKIVTDRKNHNLIQEKMAELLLMDLRSYADIEHGKHMCGTLTFTIYLLEFCDDPKQMLNEIEQLFAAAREDEYEK
ncbi:MAG: hypothetical protein IKY33_01670 [Clostridia bacterium]|nr:hypothetical protein [Clostridia bacterium]